MRQSQRDHAWAGSNRAQVSATGTARDADAYVDFLLKQKQVKGRIGTVGYCMGGGMAVRTAAIAPDSVVACVSFHGSQLVNDSPEK